MSIEGDMRYAEGFESGSQKLNKCMRKVEKLQAALNAIANHPTKDSWECKPLCDMAREVLGSAAQNKENDHG